MGTFVWGVVLEPRRIPLRIETPHDRECFDLPDREAPERVGEGRPVPTQQEF
jgi:hypothetical protein